MEYLANLLTAGDTDAIRFVLKRLAAMRRYMRTREVGGEVDETEAASVGMRPDDLEALYRLLAIAKYEDRYVIPKAHTELGERMMVQQGSCGLDFEGGPGNCGMVSPERPFDAHFMLVEWVDSGLPHPAELPPEVDDGERINLLDMLPRPGRSHPEVAG